MKYLIALLLPILLIAQDKIDPLPIISDTTDNYDIIYPHQEDFFLGWNWGTPSEKLDDALFMNFYHGYPSNSSDNNDDYADSVLIIQNIDGDIVSGRPSSAIFNSQSLYLEPAIDVVHPDNSIDFAPTLRNENGAIFGFLGKDDEIIYSNNPVDPDFGRVFFYKDSITSLPKVVLDSIWPKNLLRFYNYEGQPIINDT